MRARGNLSRLGFVVALCALNAGIPPAHAAGAARPDAAAEVTKRVLVLHDENKDELPGLARTDRSLRDAFKSALGNAVEIHSESMGLSRARQPGYEARAADFYRSKYAGRAPDLIVAVMEAPLDFLLRHADAMFPGVPIVFAGVDASTIEGKTLPANVTGVLVKRMYAPTLELALALQPQTHHVFVVGGAAPFDRFLETLVRRDLQPFESRIAMNYVFGMPMEQLLARLSSLPAHSVVLYVSVLRDGAGRRFVPADALSSIAATANAPVYVFLDQYVGLGAVGGNVYSFATHGAQVAALGLQILRGASPRELPIRELGAQVNLFDARQLERWHLDATRLPPGSEVRDRDPSVWALYRWYIVGAIVALLVQGALIAGLLLARTRQQRAEAEARRQRDDLAHVLRVTTLTELTASLAHDISQPLTAIVVNAEAARRFLISAQPSGSDDAAEALADIADSARHASRVIERLRALFRKERAPEATADVRAVIDDVVRLLHAAMLDRHIDIRVAHEQALPAVSGDPVQLEQVLLNVVMNACEAIAGCPHGPRAIAIRTRLSPPGHACIEVADTGMGVKDGDLERIFDRFVSTKPKGLGMGLAISRSIVKACGGRIWASANAGRGLTMHIELACVGESVHRRDTVDAA